MANSNEMESSSTDVKWHQNEKYILLDAPQDGTPGSPWLLYRQGRATGSVIGSVVGHSTFSSASDELDYLSGRRAKTFTARQKINMKNGNLREPFAREWYDKQNGTTSMEVGIVFPKWETRMGASVDGIVITEKLDHDIEDYDVTDLIDMAEGILEIKSPVRMYQPLTRYACSSSDKLAKENCRVSIANQPSEKQINNNPRIYEEYYGHLWHSHFDQMQQGMAVLRKPWCDYVVYSPEGVFCQRIPYCHQYYLQRLLKPVRAFLDRLDEIIPPDWRHPLPTGGMTKSVNSIK